MPEESQVSGLFVPLHPLVVLLLHVGVAAITMCARHPVLAALSCAGALACSLAERGVGATLARLRWQLPLVVLVALVNPLFSPGGATVLLRLGATVVTLESLVYGAVSGACIVASLVWLELSSQAVAPSQALAALARALPTAALAVSMTLREFGQVLGRAALVREVRAACTAARGAHAASRPAAAAPAPHGRWERALAAASAPARVSGALLAWSLSDSVERAAAMRARGWSAGRRRSAARPRPLRARDVPALALVAALVVVSAALAWVACERWSFYPGMPALRPWWGYAPFALLAALPWALSALGRAPDRPCALPVRPGSPRDVPAVSPARTGAA